MTQLFVNSVRVQFESLQTVTFLLGSNQNE